MEKEKTIILTINAIGPARSGKTRVIDYLEGALALSEFKRLREQRNEDYGGETLQVELKVV